MYNADPIVSQHQKKAKDQGQIDSGKGLSRSVRRDTRSAILSNRLSQIVNIMQQEGYCTFSRRVSPRHGRKYLMSLCTSMAGPGPKQAWAETDQGNHQKRGICRGLGQGSIHPTLFSFFTTRTHLPPATLWNLSPFHFPDICPHT